MEYAARAVRILFEVGHHGYAFSVWFSWVIVIGSVVGFLGLIAAILRLLSHVRIRLVPDELPPRPTNVRDADGLDHP